MTIRKRVSLHEESHSSQNKWQGETWDPSGPGLLGLLWEPGPVPPPKPGTGSGGTMGRSSPRCIRHFPGDGSRVAPDDRPAGGPGLAGPMARQAGLQGAGDCNIAGAGPRGPVGLKRGPVLWAAWEGVLRETLLIRSIDSGTLEYHSSCLLLTIHLFSCMRIMYVDTCCT